MHEMRCLQCGLPDLDDGAGDGIGSCECPRCEWCGGPPLVCECEHADEDDLLYADPGQVDW